MENYVVIKQVGKGSFGTAEVVEDKREKNRYILKRTRLARQPELQREASIQEMFLQNAVNHRNIVQCREKWMDKAFVANLVLEYCAQGELATTFQTRFRHQYFEEDTILDMFVQVASALMYLHENNIVHRDIKPQNIFVRADDSLAIGDFGLGRLPSTSKELADVILGTPQYMAPEVVKGKPTYSTKSDMWAMGVMFYEISALKPPFTAFNMPGLVSKITKAAMPQFPSMYSKDWKQVVQGCLQKDPSRRPTLRDLLASPFLQAAVERVNSRYGPARCSDANLEIPVEEMQQIMKRCKEGSNAGLLPTPGKARMAASARKGPSSRQGARAEQQKAKVERLPPPAPAKKAPLPSISKPKSLEPKKAAPPASLQKTTDTGAKKAPPASLVKPKGGEEKPPAALPSLQTIEERKAILSLEEKKAITDQRAAAALAKLPRAPPKPQPHVPRVSAGSKLSGETRHKKQQLPPLKTKRQKTGKQASEAKPAEKPIRVRKAAVPSFKTKSSTTTPAAESVSPSREAGGVRRDRYGMIAPSTPSPPPPGSSRQQEASKPGTAASPVRNSQGRFPGVSPTSKPQTAGGRSSRQTFTPKSPSRGGVIIRKPRPLSTKGEADGAGTAASPTTAKTKATAAREEKPQPAASGAHGRAKQAAAGRTVPGSSGSGGVPPETAQDKQQKQGRAERPSIQSDSASSVSAGSPGAFPVLPGQVVKPTKAKPQRPTVIVPGSLNNNLPSPGKALASSLRSGHLPAFTRPRTSAVPGGRGHILRASTGQVRPGTSVHPYAQSHLTSPSKKKLSTTDTSEADLERLFTAKSRPLGNLRELLSTEVSPKTPKANRSPGKCSVSSHIPRALQPYSGRQKSTDSDYGISTILNDSIGTVQSRLPRRMSMDRSMGHAGESLKAKMISLAAGPEGPNKATAGLPMAGDEAQVPEI